jgi:hypothetical protein
LREPTDEELYREYWSYDTAKVEGIYNRFLSMRDQASKRCRVALQVLTVRANDNHHKPPAQVIRPMPLIVRPKIRDPG